MELANKTAVIFGGTGAIGAATARRLALLGANIELVCRPAGLAEARALLASLPPRRHHVTTLDITDSAALLALREELSERVGTVHILVNSAGFTQPVPHADLDGLTDALIDEILTVNWRAQFAAIRALAPLLKRSGDGVIVSLSSIAGVTGVGSNIAYCAAKAGIDVMTKSLARVLAPEVRVLAIAPGVVDSDFVPGRGAEFTDKVSATTPLKRIATADEIAQAVTACCTLLGYATGNVIQIDGGRSL